MGVFNLTVSDVIDILFGDNFKTAVGSNQCYLAARPTQIISTV